MDQENPYAPPPLPDGRRIAVNTPAGVQPLNVSRAPLVDEERRIASGYWIDEAALEAAGYGASLVIERAEIALTNPRVILRGLAREDHADSICYGSCPDDSITRFVSIPRTGQVVAAYAMLDPQISGMVVFRLDLKLQHRATPGEKPQWGFPQNYESDFDSVIWHP